jgi:hypothetical protein
MSGYAYDRAMDVVCYVMLVGMMQAVVLAVAALAALAWLPSRGRAWYLRRVARFALFTFVLLACGCVGNSAFMLLTYQSLYVSADTVVDFFPFIPFGQWVLDAEFGSFKGRLLGGASLRHMQAVWGCLALAVWCGSAAAYLGVVQSIERARRVHGAA